MVKAALVKKAIVSCPLCLNGAMAANDLGELTLSLCAASTDYAPGMTNTFSLCFFKIKSGQDLEALIYN